MSFKPNQTSLKDFSTIKLLGKGSFSTVYLVQRKQDSKIYALKSVFLEKLTKKQQESSLNEVRILASIHHPNVISYKEAFWDDNTSTLNIVMEYADDGDLFSKIKKMKQEQTFFDEKKIWDWAIRLIQGLKSLHDKNIMHRDLKSENIFLFKKNSQCKIGDMNVSKVLKEKLLRTQTGTPYYASPEVWMNKPYSFKSDLWSMGCVIYEMCELKPPFGGKDMDDLFVNICLNKVKRIDERYSEDLWLMIKRLLEVNVDFVQNKLGSLLRSFVSVRDTVTKAPHENYYHGYLNGLFSNCSVNFFSEYHSNYESGDGYADIVFRSKREDKVVIIEIKSANVGDDLIALSNDALSQIESKNYATPFMDKQMVRTIYAYGIAFSGKNCFISVKKFK